LQAGILGRLESTRLGRFIKRRQVDLDLSNNELGRLTGLSQTSVSNLRTGRCKSTLRLPALARALQVSVEELEELQELQELEDHAMTTRQTPQTRKSHQQSEDMNGDEGRVVGQEWEQLNELNSTLATEYRQLILRSIEIFKSSPIPVPPPRSKKKKKTDSVTE